MGLTHIQLESLTKDTTDHTKGVGIMLSRKHYTETAKIINKSRENRYEINMVQFIPLNGIVNDLIDYFAEDNDKFDAERFRVACGVKQQEEIRG